MVEIGDPLPHINAEKKIQWVPKPFPLHAGLFWKTEQGCFSVCQSDVCLSVSLSQKL